MRSVKINDASSSLVSVDGDSIPEYIKDEDKGELIPVTHAPGTIKTVEEEKGDIVVTIGVQKANWIYIEITDQYPDIPEITVKTSDGRTISDDMIWRENGKIYVLDDPDVEYQFIYHTASTSQTSIDEESITYGLIIAFIIVGVLVSIYLVYKKKQMFIDILSKNKETKVDEKIRETDDFLEKLDKKIGIKEIKPQIGRMDKQYHLLKMMCNGNNNVEVILNSLNISIEELNSRVEESVNLGYLQFIREDEVEITDKGLYYIRSREQ